MLLLIDGNNLMFAQQHAARKPLMAGDRETTAVFGFLKTLAAIQGRAEYRDAAPIVLWDHSPTWRHEEYPDYKAKRDDNPDLVKVKERVKAQQPELIRGLHAMGIPQFRCPRMEADDLAAFFVEMAERKGQHVALVTSDKDWLQLVSMNIHWYDHTNDRKVFWDHFLEATGYHTPAHFLESKLIIGDAGDNVPGINGLGEGAASKILSQWDSFADFAAAWPEFRETIQKGDPWKRYIKKVDAVLEGDWQTTIAFARRMMKLTADVVPKDKLKRFGTDGRDEKAFNEFLARNGMTSLMRSGSPLNKINARK